MGFDQINRAGIVWYDKIFMREERDKTHKCLDISNTIAFRDFHTDYYIAFPHWEAAFIDRVYEDSVTAAEFEAFLLKGILFRGALNFYVDPPVAYIFQEFPMKDFIAHLEVSEHPSTHVVRIGKPNKIYVSKELLKNMKKSEKIFTMTYRCKACKIPECESYYAWIQEKNRKYNVLLWIHNKTNMWTARFNQFQFE